MAFYIEIIAGTGGIIHQNVWATIDEVMHKNANLMADELVYLVKLKTPIRTGSLWTDIQSDSYPDPGGEDLAYIYSATSEQIAAWQRVYVDYQEGGILGLPTYTNDPHEMFQITSDTDGPPMVEAWALASIQEALDLCIAGAGVPI